MGRKRRKSSQNNATKWETALVVPSHHSGRTIEMVGLDSDTGTVFARIASTTDNHSFVELGDVVEAVVGQCSATFAFWKAQSPDAISQELCRLGAIYVLQADTQHPQNPPKWHREHNTHRQIYDKAGTTTIRIHSRPARFPSFSQVTIVTQNDALGFVVLNKPGSCPSHATVDNALENALATVRQSYDYATLPQRLDIETFGLLLVATKPSFATYISRLLEKKTISCTTSTSDIAKDLSNHAITKKYRCLVVLSGQSDYERLQRLHQQPQIVTHYVDANSSAPKRFCEKPPPPTLNNCEKQREKETSTKWQLCQLRLTSVSPLYPVSISGSTLDGESAANASLAVALWGNHQRLPENSKYVVQVEVELLTGRTHQIRGQMAALKAPIVGDPLYGGSKITATSSGERFTSRMALQCFGMEIPQPHLLDTDISNPPHDCKMQQSETSFKIQLESAWWTPHIRHCFKTLI